jgi:starch synthase (maltosyl-transferring)
MHPAPGSSQVAYVGDWRRFEIKPSGPEQGPGEHQAFLRTNLGRAETLQKEILQRTTKAQNLALFAWQDLPMRWEQDRWILDLPLSQVGFFQAKPYLLDTGHRQTWPEGRDAGISVHPNDTRSGNTIYCAWIRLFGTSKHLAHTESQRENAHHQALDAKGYAVIPPSGKIRDLMEALPHIVDTLGCRTIHLLPINPTPTTYARFGRFGSPYAAQDLSAVDPALVSFDKHTTGLDQFRELAEAVHARGARLFMDLVANHTGWGADIHEQHPEWYARASDGVFLSPGAWGNTWGDLVELRHDDPEIWQYLAEVFLGWCRRGIDGFRCDAGYMVPLPAWQCIISRVRQEYPDTVFLLEGLGGAWEATEQLLTHGGMQWAYSELFQEFRGEDIKRYLNHCHIQGPRVGTLVHYSETHDNHRLAQKGSTWSLHRNRLCGLTSVNGAFGFTCGVEWLAREKIIVHECTGMNWGASEHIIQELAALNRLLSNHPCFFDGASMQAHPAGNNHVYLMERHSSDGKDHLWIAINTDIEGAQSCAFPHEAATTATWPPEHELLGQKEIVTWEENQGNWILTLPPGGVFCFSDIQAPAANAGRQYRETRARAALALECLCQVHPILQVPRLDWKLASECVDQNLPGWLSRISSQASTDPGKNLQPGPQVAPYPNVVYWSSQDRPRILPVAVRHWIVVRENHPFRIRWGHEGKEFPSNQASVAVQDSHVAVYWAEHAGTLEMEIQIYGNPKREIHARCLIFDANQAAYPPGRGNHMALLTNGRGAMSRMHADLGSIRSKYDCLLGANLNKRIPTDRHIFIKRIRIWVHADGFITPLDHHALLGFNANPPARWRFFAPAGNGRSVELELIMDMLQGSNSVVMRLQRPKERDSEGTELPPECRVSLTIRFDIEDRNFHTETQRNEGSEHHFNQHCRILKKHPGFEFTPSPERSLKVWADQGIYHQGAEWVEGIPHPVEQSRGQTSKGDAFSPGWFELTLDQGHPCHIVASAEREPPSAELVASFANSRQNLEARRLAQSGIDASDTWGRHLLRALEAFVVQRDDGCTVVAGYPWFLDWGRDSLIAARGMLSAGMVDEVTRLLKVFGRFESQGTLPNTIHGENASNRDTSDAPLWYGILCEDLATLNGPSIYQTKVHSDGRTLLEVLTGIATGFMQGTSNGISMDRASGLIWSPSHFTWMDTNYPAGTPREGYPIEIQALWIRLLRQLAQCSESTSGTPTPTEPPEGTWRDWYQRTSDAFKHQFWIEEKGWPSDVLLAPEGTSAQEATPDQALRSNCLWGVSLRVIEGDRARSTVEAVRQHLLIPGALRSLAPLPSTPPLSICDPQGNLLNDPVNPYWGRYEGEEDTRRKPAYHNGTGWLWTFPTFCEAIVAAWPHDPAAHQAAKDYLASMRHHWQEGCSGQLPEVIDGDAPHTQRGCDAQAWSVSEALRVWRKLQTGSPTGGMPLGKP